MKVEQMANEKLQATKLILGLPTDDSGALVRFSFLNVAAPRLNSENGKLEYGLQILIPKTSKQLIAKIKEAIDFQTKQAFPKGTGPKFWNPLRDGDTDKKNDGSSYGPAAVGHYLISAKNEEPVGVVGNFKGADGKLKSLLTNDKGEPLPPRQVTPSLIKSGDYGRVSVNFKVYTKGTTGVGVYLNNVQLVERGEALGGGGQDAADEFAAFGEENVLD